MYEKTDWKARKGENLNRFKETQLSSGHVFLENAPTSVTEPGTPFSADNMNKIEKGISDAHEMIVKEGQERTAHETDDNAHTDIRTSIANESKKRVQGDNGVLNNAKNYANQKADELNAVLNGAQVLTFCGALLTRVIHGTTPVARNLFDSSTAFAEGKTLVSDTNGSVGVCRGIDSAIVTVETITISPISSNQQVSLGVVENHESMPLTVDQAEGMDWITPSINNYITVLADETLDDNRVEWCITYIDANGNITWGNPAKINTADYQAQTTAQDAGKVLVGGAIPGTHGNSIPIDVTPTENSPNLITSGAVFRHLSFYNVSVKISRGGDYLTFNFPAGNSHFADGISGHRTFMEITNAQFFAAMQAYYVGLNSTDIDVTIGGASGMWEGFFINHITLCLIDSNTLELFLNTANSAFSFEITDSSDELQFAVNVSKQI